MREGREGREREGERDRERGSRAKPGIQLVLYITQILAARIQHLSNYKAFAKEIK